MSVPITALQRMEYIDSITFAENTQQTLPTNGGLVPTDRFLHSLVLEFRGRLTMPATGNPTGTEADGHAAIIERITIEGYHRIRRQQEKIIDVRGADLEMFQRFYLHAPGLHAFEPHCFSQRHERYRSPASGSVRAAAVPACAAGRFPARCAELREPETHRAVGRLQEPCH